VRLPGRRSLAEGVGSEVVVRFRVRATGEERWSAVKATPIKDPGGAVTMAINVIEDITHHKRAELAQRFLSESSAVLGGSLDMAQVLQHVASLAVPEVADWCAVDLVANGGLDRVALAHQDPAMVELAEKLQQRYPPDPRSDAGVSAVLRTGESQLYPEIPDELLRSGTQDEEHYRLITEIGMRSAMVVPMVARGRSVGALTFVSGPSGRRFDEQDLELAEELARRCAIAIDNARLFSERAYIARTLQHSRITGRRKLLNRRLVIGVVIGITSSKRGRLTITQHGLSCYIIDIFICPADKKGRTEIQCDVLRLGIGVAKTGLE
jgi:transcriptional regulator with GAF, ATPase, and Fis domain